MKGLRIIRQLLPEIDLDTERDRIAAACVLAGWRTCKANGATILVPELDAYHDDFVMEQVKSSLRPHLFAPVLRPVDPRDP